MDLNHSSYSSLTTAFFYPPLPPTDPVLSIPWTSAGSSLMLLCTYPMLMCLQRDFFCSSISKNSIWPFKVYNQIHTTFQPKPIAAHESSSNSGHLKQYCFLRQEHPHLVSNRIQTNWKSPACHLVFDFTFRSLKFESNKQIPQISVIIWKMRSALVSDGINLIYICSLEM